VAAQRDWLDQVHATAGGQHPFASIVGCIDSRVPPERIFDLGVGDAFVARVAGNFVDQEILGSLEFASAVAGSPLILVLGHTGCGAVKGACDGVELGNLTATLDQLEPAVEAVADESFEPRSSKNADYVAAVTHANVRLTVEEILRESEVLRDLHEQGKLLVAGAVYDVATGKVELLE
jgi:carbonic anhydrase